MLKLCAPGPEASLLSPATQKFGVSTNILLLFYSAASESVISYNYGTDMSVQSKSQFLRITGTSSKIVGCNLSHSLQEIFEHCRP